MQPKTQLNKILFFIIIAIVFVNVIILANYLFSKKKLGGSSSYGMIFTQPVMSFSGKVTAVGSNSITVEFTPVNVMTTVAGQKPSVHTYSIEVTPTDETTITKVEPAIPYVFKAGSTAGGNVPSAKAPEKKSLNDINTGDNVNVTSKDDLRFLNSGSVVASAIIISNPVYLFTGQVQSVQGSSVTIKGIKTEQNSNAATMNVPEQVTQSITVEQDTEIVSIPPATTAATKPEKATVQDIKQGGQITVYLSSNTTGKAALIQLLPSLLDRPVAPEASSAAIPKTSPTTVLPTKTR